MLLPYWKEIDFSQTKYDDNWKSKRLADEPAYTEDMQAIDRWVHRRIEFYKNKAFNDVIREQHERELHRRNRVRKALRLHMEATFGDDIPENVQDFHDHVSTEATLPTSINQDFDEDWMDEELKERGLYQPGMELIKQWLQLSVLSSNKEKIEKVREHLIAEELLSVIKYTKEDEADMSLDELCDEYDEEL